MTVVLQLKTRILGKLEAVYFLYRFSHSKGLAQLSVSPVPSPVHRIETALEELELDTRRLQLMVWIRPVHWPVLDPCNWLEYISGSFAEGD